MSNEAPDFLDILLFENNSADAGVVTEYLEASDLPHEIVHVKCLSEGLRVLNQASFDLILLDLSLPDSKGMNTLDAINAVTDEEVIIVLTDGEDEKLSLASLQAGAQDYLFKDKLTGEMLSRSIRYALERAQLMRSLELHTRETQHREALLRRIFDANIDAMLILTQDCVIKFLNPAAAELLEADPRTLVGEIFPFAVHGGESGELEIPSEEGGVRLVEMNVIDLVWNGESSYLVMLRDVSRHRHAELAFGREKERLAVTLDSISDAVITTDADGSIERMNAEAERLTGMTNVQATGQALGEVLHLKHPHSGKVLQDPAAVLMTNLASDVEADLGITLVSADGKAIVVTADMRCILDDDQANYGCVVVLRDVTAQRRVEEELFKSEKLQSISLLAGGIAHDFNNILTAVLGNISVVRLGLGEESPHADKLKAAEQAALQARSLTQQLLTFSKGGAPVLEAATIDQLVEDCAQFILRGSNVKCEVRKDGQLWPVDVDKGQLAQVVNNLMINADQAMPDGGLVTLRMKNAKLRANAVPGLKPGDYVCIDVTDNGSGIEPELLKQVFDPYFTTKVGGNGLGLASCYSIVKKHQGVITVDSALGVGTSFKVYLPRATHWVEAPQKAEPEDDTIHSGAGRILVMDDMEAMMTVAGEILEMLGYEVQLTSDGRSAITAYKNAKDSGKPFDAVIFDLTVPGGMGGEEACQILREYDPGLIAIASSGYTTSNVMSDYESAGFRAVVPKPYRIKEMSAVLHRILSPDTRG